MNLTFEISGDVQVDRTLERWVDRADNMRPALSALADDFLRIEDRQFNSQGLFASGGWTPLKQSTVERKALLGLDPRILHATLALRNALTQRGAPHQVRRVTNDEFFAGTDLIYAGVHQNPVTSPLPRRRPVELRETDRRQWIKTLQRFLVDGTIAIRGDVRM